MIIVLHRMQHPAELDVTSIQVPFNSIASSLTSLVDCISVIYCSLSITDVPQDKPNAPSSFSLSPREEESGRFNVTAANAAHTSPADELSAFLFRISYAGENYYILQVRSTVVSLYQLAT